MPEAWSHSDFFVGDRTAPLAAVSDYVVENAACNDNLVEELHIQFFALGARLMMKNGEFPQYERFVETLRKMPEVLLKVREQNDERALAFAEKHKDIRLSYVVLGAGNTWGRHIALPCACWRKCSGFLPNPFMRQNFSTALWR